MGSITFGALGSYGQLGNQLFQIATTLSLSKEYNLDVYFPESWVWKNRLKEVGKLCTNCTMDGIYTYTEPKFSYTKIHNIYGNVNIHGYFQSEKYFIDNKEYIKNTIEKDMYGYNGMNMDELKTIFSDYCFIHVRRGDYLNLQHVYKIIGIGYYNNAINIMKQNGYTKFAVLSDDINWCKQHFIGDEYKFFNGDQVSDLSIMAGCSSGIIANSSFSWWGSYLGIKKITIAPDGWFSECGPSDWHDLYRDDWKIINHK